MEKKLKVVFFGTPKEIVPVLENLVKHFDVVAVVTAPDKPVGRKQIMTPPPPKVFAGDQNIPVYQPTSLKDATGELKNVDADLYVVAAYGKIIPDQILQIPQYGAINIHPSLLPKYRGPTPIQTTLLDGITDSGITIIKMDEEMDHGPILHQIPFTLSKTDTFDWLMQAMFKQAAILLPQIIQTYVQGTLKPEPQDDTQASYTKILTKEDGKIDLENPPSTEKLDNMIRAFYPWPNVWTITNVHGKETRVKFLPKKHIQMEGKQPVHIKDFINGYPELGHKISKMLPQSSS
jgi:methionyl-tRNA formyltransferase